MTIIESLKLIDRFYNRADSTAIKIHLSKTAILEASGWLEVEIDKIISRRPVEYSSVVSGIVGTKVNKTYAFDFNSLATLLIYGYGPKAVDKCMLEIGDTQLETLKNELKFLKNARDKLAHTNISPPYSISIDSPSITINRLKKIQAVLYHFQRSLCESLSTFDKLP